MGIATYDIHGETAAGGGDTQDTEKVILGELLMVRVRGDKLTAGANLTLQTVDAELGGAESLGETLLSNGDVGAMDGVGGRDISYLYPRRKIEDVDGTALDLNDNEAGDQEEAVPFVIPGTKVRATMAAGGGTVKYTVTLVVRE